MRKLYGSIAVLLLFASTAQAQLTFGGGATLGGATSFDTPGGERLNIDLNNAFALLPGTYDVADFQLNVANFNEGTAGAGTVTPFLVTSSPSSDATLWVGRALDPAAKGVQTEET